MTETKREFDLVILGATGYTGLLVVRELVLSIEGKPEEYSALKWAIAGRSLTKLDDVLSKVGNELGKNLSQIEKIQADVSDEQSLVAMAERTKLVVNSVGPYRLYGTPVVDACVRSGTHHIDVSAEPTYIEGSQLDYDAKAKDSGSLVISTCGVSSIPADIGVDFLKKNFPGKLHSVDSFMAIHPGPEGYVFNSSTLESGVYFISGISEYLRIRSRLRTEVFSKIMPKSNINHPPRLLPFVQPKFPGWNMNLPGDKDVIERTQYYNYDQLNERPVQVQTYFNVATFGNLLKIIVLSTIIAPFTFFRAGRYLLKQYPEVFTLGYFTKGGPTRSQGDSTQFSLRLIGKGWASSKVDAKADPLSEPSKQLDKEMTVIISGRDPGYQAASTCMVQAALTIFKEREKMPKGGVLTPASAFRDTKIVERLQSREIKFEIIDN